MNKPSHVDFPPIENGLDYLDSVVRGLDGTPSPRDLKYVILHLYAGIEVLLKVRLAREHWSLLFAKVEAATQASFASGDFNSVSAEGAIDRLVKVVGIAITDNDRVRIGQVGRLRNRLQHFGLTESAQHVSAVAAKALDFLLRFVDQQLRQGGTDDEIEAIEATLDSIRETLRSMQVTTSERLASLKQPLADATDPVMICPGCGHPCLVLVSDTPRCLFCMQDWDPETLADEYVQAVLGLSEYVVVKDGGEWPIHSCTSCERMTLVEGATVIGSVDVDWVCFSCGLLLEALEIDRCGRCGVPTQYGDGDGMAVCQDCAAYIFSAP